MPHMYRQVRHFSKSSMSLVLPCQRADQLNKYYNSCWQVTVIENLVVLLLPLTFAPSLASIPFGYRLERPCIYLNAYLPWEPKMFHYNIIPPSQASWHVAIHWTHFSLHQWNSYRLSLIESFNFYVTILIASGSYKCFETPSHTNQSSHTAAILY